MTDAEWLEADYWDDLEKQWRESLPTEMDFLLAFPELVKRKEIDLKAKISELTQYIRECKNLATKDFKNRLYYQWLVQRHQNRQGEIKAELSRLGWIGKPVGENPTYDIAKAKLFPIPNIVEVKRKLAKCPWHEDRTPSLHYYDKTNTVYCFACNKSGDAIDVAMAVWDLDWKEAVVKLT